MSGLSPIAVARAQDREFVDLKAGTAHWEVHSKPSGRKEEEQLKLGTWQQRPSRFQERKGATEYHT